MKVGVVGPIWLNIPPAKYGGTEEVVYNLVNGLSERGHDVTLFGPGTAKVKGKLVPTVEKPLLEIQSESTNCVYPLYHITCSFDIVHEFDILHVHLNRSSDYVAMPLAIHSKKPVLFTIHFKLFGKTQGLGRYELFYKYRFLPFTSISDSQRKPMALNYIDTVYNALDLSCFRYSDKVGSYLVWLGRVTKEKGTKEAILAAKEVGMKIYLMGVVDRSLPTVVSYYEQEIKPLIDEKQVIWLGGVSQNEKASILSGAFAMLNPIRWEEPFGLVMIEAQATGTPVISFRRGAAPEIIIDGKTGFLVDTLEEMVEKIGEVDTLSRKACRENVESRFCLDRMIDGYEHAYETVIRNWDTYLHKQMVSLYDNK